MAVARNVVTLDLLLENKLVGYPQDGDVGKLGRGRDFLDHRSSGADGREYGRLVHGPDNGVGLAVALRFRHRAGFGVVDDLDAADPNVARANPRDNHRIKKKGL